MAITPHVDQLMHLWYTYGNQSDVIRLLWGLSPRAELFWGGYRVVGKRRKINIYTHPNKEWEKNKRKLATLAAAWRHHLPSLFFFTGYKWTGGERNILRRTYTHTCDGRRLGRAPKVGGPFHVAFFFSYFSSSSSSSGSFSPRGLESMSSLPPLPLEHNAAHAVGKTVSRI
jgi:hypothetical protein